jgi:hypothetical protein
MEPKGCPTPGACSCPTTPRAAGMLEAARIAEAHQHHLLYLRAIGYNATSGERQAAEIMVDLITAAIRAAAEALPETPCAPEKPWRTIQLEELLSHVGVTPPTSDPGAILRAITSEEMVETAARELYEREKARANNVRDVLQAASGKPCAGILMEPWEECADVFRRDACAALSAVADALRPMLGTGGPRWRHKTRGTTYVEIGRATVQASTGTIDEDNIVVVYRSEDGRLWARERREFEDGRFEPVPPTQELPR